LGNLGLTYSPRSQLWKAFRETPFLRGGFPLGIGASQTPLKGGETHLSRRKTPLNPQTGEGPSPLGGAALPPRKNQGRAFRGGAPHGGWGEKNTPPAY